ncbi:hypothetical protein ABD440_13445, partial [Chromobacterium piscinae]|uniref:hypothetical protein n=1 Tax=Chromobacterium piscinae TaxID=686831 RepID=UPI0031FCD945
KTQTIFWRAPVNINKMAISFYAISPAPDIQPIPRPHAQHSNKNKIKRHSENKHPCKPCHSTIASAGHNESARPH